MRNYQRTKLYIDFYIHFIEHAEGIELEQYNDLKQRLNSKNLETLLL